MTPTNFPFDPAKYNPQNKFQKKQNSKEKECEGNNSIQDLTQAED